MEMYNRGKFHLYSISGCEVKKFEIFSRRWSIQEWPIFESFWALTPPNIVRSCWNFHHSYYPWGVRHHFKIFWKLKFLLKWEVPKVCGFFSVFVQLWPHFSPWRSPKSNKLNNFKGQNYAIGLSKNLKIKDLSCPNFSGKIRLLFVPFWQFFAEKGTWFKVKGLESKWDPAHVTNTTPGIQNMQRVRSHHSRSWAFRCQRSFFCNFQPLLQVWLLF